MSAPRAAQAVDTVARMLLGAPLPLGVRCWDGSQTEGPPGAPTLVVRTPRTLRTFLYAPNEIGLARAYVRGDLDIEGDLYAALSFPDELPERPALKLDRRALTAMVLPFARLGVLGPPPRRPVEESRMGGRLHSLRRDRAAIHHHYDVGNDFYSLLLGPSLVYSCGYFADGPQMGVDAAQEAKLELVCAKLGLRSGMRLLDVGCGWGSLVLHAAARRGVTAVGVTLSVEQAAVARERVAAAGLDGLVEIRVQDYREVADGPYDAIASVGMAEHVGREHLPAYAAHLHALLAPGGRLLNHAISVGPDGDDTPDPGGFLARYVFPDGDLQRLATHIGVLEGAGFEVRDVEGLREHYALTCRAWVANLERRWEEAVRLSSPGRARVWRLYLAGSALAFEGRRVGVNQVLAVKAGGGAASADRAAASADPVSTAEPVSAADPVSAAEPLPLRRPDWSRRDTPAQRQS